MSIRIPVVFVALPVLACASSGSSPRQEANPFATVITREDLQQLDVRTAYDAIERLRPRWLQVRGGMRSFSMETEVVVFQDEMFLGNQEVLQRMGTEGIYSIRYLDGPTAKASLPGLGSRHVQGAIIVSMRPPTNPNEEPPAGA